MSDLQDLQAPTRWWFGISKGMGEDVGDFNQRTHEANFVLDLLLKQGVEIDPRATREQMIAMGTPVYGVYTFAEIKAQNLWFPRPGGLLLEEAEAQGHDALLFNHQGFNYVTRKDDAPNLASTP